MTQHACWSEACLASHNHYHQLVLWQVAEMGLQQADHTLNIGKVTCQQSWQSHAVLLQHGDEWWHSANCCHNQFNGIEVDYYLTPLQYDPCAHLAGKAVRYW